MANRTRFNQTAFVEEVQQWELQWTRQTGVELPTTPARGALETARQVYARYFD